MSVHEITDYEKWVEAVEPVWAEFGAGLEDLIAEEAEKKRKKAEAEAKANA